MTDNEIIDIILKALFEKVYLPYVYLKSTILKTNKISIEKNHLNRIVLKMTHENLVEDKSDKGLLLGKFA